MFVKLLFLLFVVFREMNSQASKVFLTSDLCDNRYLCFLVESHQHLRSTVIQTLQACMCFTIHLGGGGLWSFSGQQVCFLLFLQMCEIYWEQRHISAHLRLSHNHPCQRCRASAGRLRYSGFSIFKRHRQAVSQTIPTTSTSSVHG